MSTEFTKLTNYQHKFNSKRGYINVIVTIFLLTSLVRGILSLFSAILQASFMTSLYVSSNKARRKNGMQRRNLKARRKKL